MEGFRKMIYKKPEWHTSTDDSSDPEVEKVSEDVARQKLERVYDPELDSYAVRYMNIAQYREMLESGKLVGEFILYGRPYEYRKQYVPRLQKSIPELIEMFKDAESTRSELSETQWEQQCGVASLVSRDIVSRVRRIIDGNKEGGMEDQLSLLRDELLRYIESGPDYDPVLDGYISKWAKINLSRLKLSGATNEDDIEQELILGAENMRIIEEFKRDPNYLLQKGNLRKIVTALGNIHDPAKQTRRQYHVAVFFDIKQFQFDRSQKFVDDWVELNIQSMDKDQKKGFSVSPHYCL